MDKPDGPDDIIDLVKYYSPNMDAILLRKARAILGRCKPEVRRQAIDWLTDNIPRQDGKYKHELSVTDIKQALQEIGETASEYLPAEQWTCDACGIGFQYAQVVEYFDKHDKAVFDSCPRCGLQPCETIRARSEAKLQRGHISPWYPEWIERIISDWHKRGNGTSAWIFNKREDDDYMAKQRRDEIETMKREAADEVRMLAERTRGIDRESPANEAGRG